MTLHACKPWRPVGPLSGLAVALCIFFLPPRLSAQTLPAEVEQMGYADTLFTNGKIVSMEDASTSTSVGRVYQAVAVKGNKIMKLGTAEEVRPMAGRLTKVFDLKGRTLIPGIVEPHQHIYGNAFRHAARFGLQWPPKNVIWVEATADKDLEKTNGIIRDTIRESVKKVKPGDWIMLELNEHPEQPQQASLWGMTRRLPNRKTLDLWAPANPVLVRPGLRGNINSKALEVLNEFLPGYSASIQESMHGVDIGEDVPSLGWVGSREMQVIEWELFLNNVNNTTLAQMLKAVSEEWASIGVTT